MNQLVNEIRKKQKSLILLINATFDEIVNKINDLEENNVVFKSKNRYSFLMFDKDVMKKLNNDKMMNNQKND